jgi:anti-sigma B factor antagonist
VKPAGDERIPDGGGVVSGGSAPEQLMTVRTLEVDDALVVEVTGEVDGLTTRRLREALAAAFARLDGRPLVLDLTDVRFLGSPGLRALFDSAREASGQEGFAPLRVVVDHTRPVIRPIEIVGLDAVLALFHTRGDALAGHPAVE